MAVEQDCRKQVVIANDSNRRDQARQIAENLSKDKQVLAVVGHYTSPNTCAALNVYSDNNLVVIAPTSTMVNLPSNQNCGGDPNKVFFRTVSSTRVEAQTLIGYLVNDLKQTQPRVVAFYNPNELFSNDMFEQFEQVLTSYGGELIAAFDLSDPKLQADQLPPQVSQADAIAILPDGGTDSDTALQKAVDFIKLNDGDKPILGANTLYLQKVINEGQDTLVDRLFIAVDWHPQQCGAETFSQQVREYWGGDLNRRTALAYEALQVIVSKLPAAPASKVTRGYIRQKLSETGITEGAAPQSDVLAGQTISFDARGDRREITTRAIVTVNDQLRFALAKDDNCPGI
ncbi:MAG: ABC transporter substrate-binding protein [Cyanobacteria bacterium J06635_1]